MKRQLFGIVFALALFSEVQAQTYERYKSLGDTVLVSKNLGFNKTIGITVPIEWQRALNQRFPVIVIFDSQNSRSHGYLLQTIDYLTSNEQMPACVVLSIESAQEHRYFETLHPASSAKGLALANEAFIFEELLPMAERQFQAGGFRLFIGHSRYGYFTTSLLKSRTAELQAVISLSPFFEQTNVNLIDSIAQINFSALKTPIYYRYGIGNDYPEDFEKMENMLKSINPSANWNAKGMWFPMADHNVTPGLSIATALYDIFEAWSRSQSKYFANEQTDLSIFASLESEIKTNYGFPLAMSLGTLNGKGWFFYNNSSYDLAIQAWQILLKYYPNFSEGHLYIMDAEQKLKRPTKASEASFLTSIKNSTFYTEAEKIELMQEFSQMQNPK